MRIYIRGTLPGSVRFHSVKFSRGLIPWFDYEKHCWRWLSPCTRYYGVNRQYIGATPGHAIFSSVDTLWT